MSDTGRVLNGNRSIILALDTPVPLPGAPAGASLGANTATLNILDNESGGKIQFASATQTVQENVAKSGVVVP